MKSKCLNTLCVLLMKKRILLAAMGTDSSESIVQWMCWVRMYFGLGLYRNADGNTVLSSSSVQLSLQKSWSLLLWLWDYTNELKIIQER